MNKSPAFQFYPADYLADENVTVMTLEEEGAYIRAMAYCWREGSIPADDKRLGALLKGASNQILTVVRKCFVVGSTDSTRLVHPRLELERKKQAEWRDKSANAGKESGKSRRAKKFSTEPTFVNGSTKHEPNHEPNTNSSSSSLSSSSNPPPITQKSFDERDYRTFCKARTELLRTEKSEMGTRLVYSWVAEMSEEAINDYAAKQAGITPWRLAELLARVEPKKEKTQ